MSETKTLRDLLVVALQDLYDGELAWGEAGAELCAAAGDEVSAFLTCDLGRSAVQADALRDALRALDAPLKSVPNIWLRAIIDDARRDAQSIVAGPLRDTALIGAFRKGKQAERVSYETAIRLAHRLGQSEIEAQLVAIRDQEARADRELDALLSAVIASMAV